MCSFPKYSLIVHPIELKPCTSTFSITQNDLQGQSLQVWGLNLKHPCFLWSIICCRYVHEYDSGKINFFPNLQVKISNKKDFHKSTIHG